MADEVPFNLSASGQRNGALRVGHRGVPDDLCYRITSGPRIRAGSTLRASVAPLLGSRVGCGGARGGRSCHQPGSREPGSLHGDRLASASREPATRPESDARHDGCRRHGNRHCGHHGFAARLIGARPFFVVSGVAGALVASPAVGQAQYSSVCGVTGDATAPATITYDPFAPGGLSQATIPLILQRTRNFVQGRTDQVSLILTAPAGTPPLTVTYEGFDVLYPEGATAGRPRALSGPGAGGEIRYEFGGLFSSDLSSPLNLRVSVPPGTDLVAGEPVYFDIVYICSANGLMLDVPVPTRLSRAIRLDVRVVSALQAYYAGSVLDFGEIGDVSTQQVLADPQRYATPATNSLRVRSSGPFEVQLRSQNDFRLTYPGGNVGDPAQTIRYSVRFLGQDVASNAAFGTRTCARAGIGGAAGMLPLRARLTEGGAGKTPSPNYADTITVTFTPILFASAAQSCAGL